MRFVILGINYSPEVTGIGPYTAGLGEYLASQGHDVVVSTTFPHYPGWKWQVAHTGWRQNGRLNGVEVRRWRVILPKQSRVSWRVAYDLSFASVALLSSMGIPRADVVLSISPPIQLSFTGALLARRWRVPLVLLVKDLPLQAALSVGMMRTGTAFRVGEWLERKAYTLADKIVVINGRFRQRLVDQAVPPAKVTVIPDWSELDQITPRMPEQKMRTRLGGSPRDFIVLHAGNMGEKQGLANAVRATQIASRRSAIRLALVGDGAHRQRLEQMVVGEGINCVTLLPLQAASDFARMLAAADALLLNQRADVQDSVAPSKLLAYMAAARPVLAAANQDSVAARLVQEAGCGLVVRPEDPEALANAFRDLDRDPGRRHQFGLAGRRFVEEHFEKNAILGQWDSLLTHYGDLAR